MMRHWLSFLLLIPLAALAATFTLPGDGSSVVGEITVVEPSGDNTLLDIARHFDVGYEEMVTANPGVSVWTPGGARVVVPARFILPPRPWRGIVINIPQRRLYYFPPPAREQPPQVITYPVSIAREGWSTPLGATRIVAKYRNPSWFVPKSIQAEHLREEGIELPEYFPPGPDNPMGMLALRTGFPGIFIHATNHPWGIGMRTSHGCIHLYPEDAAELFPLIQVGTPVQVINAPVVLGSHRGQPVMATFEPVAEYPQSLSGESQAFEALQDFLPGEDVTASGNLIDWRQVDQLMATPQPVPTGIAQDASGEDTAWRQQAPLRYDFPPYGTDANNARVPESALTP